MQNKLGKMFAIMTLAGALALAPMTVRAQEEDASEATTTLDLPVLSAYVWRGQVLNDEAVAQPSLTVSKYGVSLNIWANYNFTDQATGEAWQFSEYDYLLSYNFICLITGAGVSVGVVNYSFPNTTFADTSEAFLSYGLSDVQLAPTLSVYYDFDEADGFYGNLGISHSIALGEKASADLACSAGVADSDFNKYYYGIEDAKFNDGNVSLSVPVTVRDDLTVTPAIQYTWLWDNRIEDAADGLYFDDNQWIGSLTASYTF